MLGRARAHMPNGPPMASMAQDNDQPVYIDRGHGPGFTDVDGFTYLDFNASDIRPRRAARSAAGGSSQPV
jgi:glutamate-1-semialdehyde aminotransferase